MREISPATNATADECLEVAPPEFLTKVELIRAEKRAGTRTMPSTRLVDRSNVMTASQRKQLLDRVATLVDEDLFGRGEMCIQFADLLGRALQYLGVPSRAVVGTAMYYVDGREVFRWDHAWVRCLDEVVDGNVDSVVENPMVPDIVRVAPYWGPVAQIPPDRRLREAQGARLPFDEDVANIWWPELLAFLDRDRR